jgi:hypothetical protein
MLACCAMAGSLTTTTHWQPRLNLNTPPYWFAHSRIYVGATGKALLLAGRGKHAASQETFHRWQSISPTSQVLAMHPHDRRFTTQQACHVFRRH